MCPDPRPEPHTDDNVIDADVDLHDSRQRAEIRPHEWQLIAVIAAGGVMGAESRHGLDQTIAYAAGDFPWATLIVNLSGALLIGVLMVLVLEVLRPHRFLRPFLGVGVLGGYTTFSTFGVEAVQLVRAHRPGLALGYVLASAFGCVFAVWLGSASTRRLSRSQLGSAAAPAAMDNARPVG